MSYFDIVLDNVRDLMKHVKKERIISSSIHAVNFSNKIFGEEG